MEANFSFDKEARSRFFVVCRAEKRLVGEYDCPAMISFHYVNAFEEADGASVHVDLCRYEHDSTLAAFYLDKLRAGETSSLSPVEIVRYTLTWVGPSAGVGNVVRGFANERSLGAH